MIKKMHIPNSKYIVDELARLQSGDFVCDALAILLKRSGELNIAFGLGGEIVDGATKKRLRYNHARTLFRSELKRLTDCSNITNTTLLFIIDTFLESMKKAGNMTKDTNLFPDHLRCEQVADGYI